ncbi:tyrosine-type recombinase/integrase [Paenirhodobacter populi]|nr:site-specific integrase [Sinirhodobacter populi]
MAGRIGGLERRASVAMVKRVEKALTDKAVKALRHPGDKDGHAVFAVGGDGCEGLSLQVSKAGGKSWILRATINGKRREIGLGTYPEPITLADAREQARELKRQIAAGRDPIAERQAARQPPANAEPVKPRSMTFRTAVSKFLASGQLDLLQNRKHAAQWGSTLYAYAVPTLGVLTVEQIDKHSVADALAPIWWKIPETARRVRGRIETVIRFADGLEKRDRANPARWKDNLDDHGALTRPGEKRDKKRKASKKHHPALPVDDAPAWFTDLRGRDGVSVRALEFLALMAARSGEVRGALWSEIDLKAAVWTVPGERMKMDEEHRVPLSPAAVALLEALPRMAGSELVFTAPRGGELSDMALSVLMRKMHAREVKAGRTGWLDARSKRIATPHGMRACFRTWVQDRTAFPREIAEAALAHKSGDDTENAYARGDYFERRRQMMGAWADYLTSTEAAQEAQEAAE